MNQATVFIVEDDEEFTQLLKLRIEAEGHRVLTAANGDEAYELIQMHQPDLVILDIFLPDTDGLTILKRLKSSVDVETGKPSRTKAIPVVVLTGKAPMVENIARVEGAADFFVKPVDTVKLADRVCKLLEAKRHDRGSKRS